MVKIPENSIDYAVMEKSSKVKVVVSDLDWSDTGRFNALYGEMRQDEHANTINKNHVNIYLKSNLIHGNHRKIVTIDAEDLMIVDTKGALLLSKKGSSQKNKQTVEKIKQVSDPHNVHEKAYISWRNYTVFEDTPGHKIKKIEAKLGKRLSLQKHFHRNEHWIVISGTAMATVGDKTTILRQNKSTYIKIGEIYQFSNEGKIPVILIEAQVGEYISKDDNVRFSDDFDG